MQQEKVIHSVKMFYIHTASSFKNQNTKIKIQNASMNAS